MIILIMTMIVMKRVLIIMIMIVMIIAMITSVVITLVVTLVITLVVTLLAAQGHSQSEVEPAYWAMAQDEGIEPSIDIRSVHPDINC